MSDHQDPLADSRPIITWKMLWTDGNQYGMAFELPGPITARNLLDRDLHRAKGHLFGDDPERMGEMIGRHIAETIRGLCGVVEPTDYTDAELDAYLEQMRPKEKK